MYKLRIAVLLFLTLTMVEACERSNQNEPLEFVIVGSTENMRVLHLDTILIGSYQDKRSLNIDLNEDGYDDYRLNSYIFGSTHNPSYGSSIECLHEDATLLTSSVMDTTYYCCSNEQISDEQPGEIRIYYYNNFNCTRLNDEDSIVSYQKINIVQDTYLGDTLDFSDRFSSDTLEFAKGWYNLTEEIIYESNDTIIYKIDIYECYKYRVKNNKLVYFGLKLNDKFGWLKLSITDDYKMSIYEATIQN